MSRHHKGLLTALIAQAYAVGEREQGHVLQQEAYRAARHGRVSYARYRCYWCGREVVCRVDDVTASQITGSALTDPCPKQVVMV